MLYCARCDEETALTDAGICLWCDHPLTALEDRPAARAAYLLASAPTAGPPPKPKAAPRGRPPRLSDETLRALHSEHLEGASLRELARRIGPDYDYAKPSNAGMAISRGWARLGLEARSQAEATRLGTEKRTERRRTQWLAA